MARRRGGHAGRGGRSHASDRPLNDNVHDSSNNIDDNESSPENLNVANGSGPDVDIVENSPDGDQRKQVRVVNKRLLRSSECSRAITKIFKEQIDDKAYTWTKVSQETKNFYFEEFKKHFVWDPHTETQVRQAWDAKASARYTDLMRDVRRKMIKPTFIADYAWSSFRDHWETPQYKEKQKINIENRLKGEGSSTHTGGSISYVEHAQRLESILDRPPTPFELFLHTQTKGHDKHTFINERSRAINDNMLRLKEARQTNLANPSSATTESQLNNEASLYYEAAGGKRKRVYGNGSKVFDYYLNANTNSPATTSKDKADEDWKSKYFTTERRLKKLSKKTSTLNQTLESVCKHIGIPVPDLDGESEDSDQEENAEDVHQTVSTSCPEKGGSNEDANHGDI